MENLHLMITMSILKHKAPQTLVLATGDGKNSDFGTSFPELIEVALKAGWTAELWSWDAGRNRKYAALEQRSGGRFSVYSLDPYYYSVTYLQAGVCFDKDAAGNPINPVTVAARYVQPLP
ncbi:MAG: hypothetical protein IPH10_10415 [bacterium]|nr:hypothetical protein [bacterium]